MALENHNFWRWAIILRERVGPDLVKSQFYTSLISREPVVPDGSKWIKSPILERLHLTLNNRNFPTIIAVWLSCDGVAPGLTKLTFCHMLGRPTWAISAEGCPYPKEIPHSTTCSGVRHARSPQTVAAGKEDSHFTTPHLCPSDTRDLRRGLPKDKQDPHFTTCLGVRQGQHFVSRRCSCRREK